MTRIILHGCQGRMGRTVADLASEEGVRIVAGVTPSPEESPFFPAYASVEKVVEDADVVIDFSTAKAVDSLLEDCLVKKLPLVLCTTGLSEDQMSRVEEVSREIPVLMSANMSLGINVLRKMLYDHAALLAEAGFDIEIVEKHHNQKLDAPSGTAIALADAANASLERAGEKPYGMILDRSKRRMKRPHEEIGISAVRGGTIVGDHDVIFAGVDEVVTLSHRAYSRAIFAKGALAAAKFLAGKEAGRYKMADVIG